MTLLQFGERFKHYSMERIMKNWRDVQSNRKLRRDKMPEKEFLNINMELGGNVYVVTLKITEESVHIFPVNPEELLPIILRVEHIIGCSGIQNRTKIQINSRMGSQILLEFGTEDSFDDALKRIRKVMRDESDTSDCGNESPPAPPNNLE